MSIRHDGMAGLRRRHAGGLTSAYTGSNNTNCGGNGFPSIGLISDCSRAFADAAKATIAWATILQPVSVAPSWAAD